MITIKNENGNTLILVLIMLTVTMVLAMALTGGAITTNKHFNKTDNNNRALDLAEMGVTYYQKLANSLIIPAQNQVSQKINTNFCTEFTNLLKSNDGTVNVENNNKFQVSLSTNPSKTTSCTNTLDTIQVYFNSIGITDTLQQYKIEGNFKITKMPDIPVVPRDPKVWPDWDPTGNTKYSNTDKVYYGDYQANQDKIDEDTKKDIVINTFSWFKTIFDNGNRHITINNLAYFESISTTLMNSHSNITVFGDAVFLGPYPKPLPPGSVDTNTSLCVSGNIYYKNNSNSLEIFNDASKYFNITTTCKNSNNNSNNWHIDGSYGIKVNYNPQ